MRKIHADSYNYYQKYLKSGVMIIPFPSRISNLYSAVQDQYEFEQAKEGYTCRQRWSLSSTDYIQKQLAQQEVPGVR